MTLRSCLLSLAACLCLLPAAARAQTPASPANLPPTLQSQLQLRLRALQVRRAAHPGSVTPSNGTPTGGTSALIETIAGSAPFQKPVNALQTGLGIIADITEDTRGDLYIALNVLGTVVKVDTSGNAALYAGQPLASGPISQSGDGGPAVAAHIPGPYGLAVDSSGNVFISDIEEGTIREVNGKTGIIQTIAGIPGAIFDSSRAGDGGPATQAELYGPSDLALDGNGNLYFVDGGNLRQISLTTGIIQTVAGYGWEHSASCQLTASNTCPGLNMGGITHIAIIPGHIYFSQSAGTANISAIGELDTSTWTAHLIAGGGQSAGTSSTYPAIGSTFFVYGMTADTTGNLFFSDLNTDQVWEILASNRTMHVAAGTGTSTGSGDGSPALTAGIDFVLQLCFSPIHGIDFVDRHRIRSFIPGGNISALAGNGYANDFGDGGPSISAGLDQPGNIISDTQGNLYVSEAEGNLVRRVDAHSGIITTIAGSNQLNVSADGLPATSAGLQPSGLAVDEIGHRLLMATVDTVRAVDLNTDILSTVAPTSIPTSDLAFDGDHILYLSDGEASDEVAALDTVTGATTVIAGGPGNSLLGPQMGVPATSAYLGYVAGLALDNKGTLYIADYWENNIRNVDLATDIINYTAGPVSPEGVPPYSGDGGPAIDATFQGLSGIAYSAGTLAIVDAYNYVIRQIDLTSGIVTTLAGAGAPGFSGDGGPASQAMFDFMERSRLTYDPAGNLYIADTYNDRIRRIVLHPTKLNATVSATADSNGAGTFTAAYTGLAFGIPPTGTVSFAANGISVGSEPISLLPDNSGNYGVSIATGYLLSNNATLTAQYSGDGNYAPLTTTATFQPLPPAYTVSAKPASLTLAQGATGNVTFTVTPENGFNQAVAFACGPLPTGVSCSFSPASVTPGGAPIATTLTLKTTGAATSAALQRPAPPTSGWLPRGGALLSLLLFVLPGVRRRAHLAGLATVLFAICLAGCGGGSSSSSGSGSGGSGGGSTSTTATPAGSYSLTVTTTAGATAAAQNVPFTLTITQ